MRDSELDNASEHVRYERDMLRFTAQWLLVAHLDAFKKDPSQEPHATSSHSRTIR